MNGIVEAAYLLEDADVSARAYELLSPYAHLPMIGSLGIACFGSTEHALGLASVVSGDLDRAVDHFRAAIRRNLALAHWPAVVASRQRLARALELRGWPEDARAARRELDAAASEAAALGIPVADRAATMPSGASAQCSRVGRKWRVAVANRSVLVEHSIGMAHLAVLIANPRQEIQAADLVAGLAVLAAGAGDETAAHPVLDREAIREYRNRIKRLEAEIDELGTDPDRALRARAERDWLVAELASAAGLGGRIRSFPDQGERARVAAGKAIRRAIVRITEADEAIGEHLRQTVHTGVRCSYWPT
jgi:hypothetical protein